MSRIEPFKSKLDEIKEQIQKTDLFPLLEKIAENITDEDSASLFLWTSDVEAWKMNPLLIGLKPEVFEHLILAENKDVDRVLLSPNIREPLVHQLNHIIREAERLLNLATSEQIAVTKKIQTINLNDLDYELAGEITADIDSIAQKITNYFPVINRALLLAWNLNRTETIEKLSLLKDVTQKMLVHSIGRKYTETEKPTGLYLLYLNKLLSVFNGRDPLKEEDPIEEGLIRLGIIYPEDFHDVGKNLDGLKEMGLTEVGSLKARFIVSKKMLKDYINSKR